MPPNGCLVRLARPGEPASASPVFQTIAVVGLDGPGATIARATRRAWPSSLVVAIDRIDSIERAVRQGVIDVGSRDLMLASGADLVVLASTPEANLEVIGRLAEVIEQQAVVVDLGGNPRPALEAARDLPPQLVLVAGYLLDDTGPSAVEPPDVDRLGGRVWLLVGETEPEPSALDRLSRFASGLGATPRVVSEDEFVGCLTARR